MEGPGVVVSTARQARPESTFSHAKAAWTPVWWISLLLVLAGLVDLSLALYPAQLDVAQWRFAAFASVANGLPLPAVGIFGTAMAAIASERVGRARLALGLGVLAILAMVVILVGFTTAIGESVASAPADVRLGLQKSAFKTV